MAPCSPVKHSKSVICNNQVIFGSLDHCWLAALSEVDRRECVLKSQPISDGKCFGSCSAVSIVARARTAFVLVAKFSCAFIRGPAAISTCSLRPALIMRKPCFLFIRTGSWVTPEIGETNFRRILVRANARLVIRALRSLRH